MSECFTIIAAAGRVFFCAVPASEAVFKRFTVAAYL